MFFLEQKNGGGAERVFRKERRRKKFKFISHPRKPQNLKRWAGRKAERLKKLKDENDKKTKKLDRCQKIRYGYKGNFQRCLFSYSLECIISTP